MNSNNQQSSESHQYFDNSKARLVLLCELYFPLFIIMWTIWYTHLNPAYTWAYPVILCMLLYLVLGVGFLASILSRRMNSVSYQGSFYLPSLYVRGVGNQLKVFKSPRKFWLNFRIEIVVITLFFTGLYWVTLHHHWPKIESSLNLEVNGNVFPNLLWVLPGMLLPTMFLLLVLVRWDNIREGLDSVFKVALTGVGVIIFLHILLRLYPELPTLTSDTALQKFQNFSITKWISQFTLYIYWAWIQQFIVLGVIATTLSRVVDIDSSSGRHVVSLNSALLFGIMHLPNIWLFMITFVLGYMLAQTFLRHRNLFVVSLVHALIASLYYQLLPLSLSPKLKGFNGDIDIYEWSRVLVFGVMFLTFVSLLFRQKKIAVQLRVILGAFMLFLIILLYPSNSQGPDFLWGVTGNGKGWRSHNMSIISHGSDYTEYEVKGRSPYIRSQPLIIDSDKQDIVEIEISFGTPGKVRGVIYPDFGQGFREDLYIVFPLQQGRHKYRHKLNSKQTPFRIKFETDAAAGTRLRIHSFRFVYANDDE